jgi:hypothetical protein
VIDGLQCVVSCAFHAGSIAQVQAVLPSSE